MTVLKNWKECREKLPGKKIDIQRERESLMQTEHELELHKELEDLEERIMQCEKMERKLEQMEDDMIWRSKLSKELYDDLFACYPQDQKMQQPLLDREEMMEQRIVRERSFFREFQESIYEMKKRTNQQIGDCREEIERAREENPREGDRNEDNSNIYNI